MPNKFAIQTSKVFKPKCFRRHCLWLPTIAILCVLLLLGTSAYLLWNLAYNTYDSQTPRRLNQDTPFLWQHHFKFNATSRHDNEHLQQYNIQSSERRSLENQTHSMRLICYYSIPKQNDTEIHLNLSKVNARLCTHINIGMVLISNDITIEMPSHLVDMIQEAEPLLRKSNPYIKLQLWVGGNIGNNGFSNMVQTHSNRKIFIQSLMRILHTLNLDGVDLDWEFPSAHNKERMHFSQLLYEIKQEYRREKHDYVLSVAVAAPEGIALFAYDVNMLNTNADYISLMTYDYHFYSPNSPFTGLNAPLYVRSNEHSVFATLNINYSVHWWLNNGLDRDKLVVGLPLYGHSFTLVNPFNTAIGAPAQDVGKCGDMGFPSFSEICWFKKNHIASITYDNVTCSPYMSSGTEWISFENIQSITCKTRYIKELHLGGVMVFSLNADDFQNICETTFVTERQQTENILFPLTETVQRILTEK